MKRAAPGEGKGRHQGEENEGSSDAGGGGDKIAAAGHLPFFAGFLSASRCRLLGLVGLWHKSVVGGQKISELVSKSFPRLPERGRSGRRKSAARTPPHRTTAP